MKKMKARAVYLPLLALTLAFGLLAVPSVTARTISPGEATSSEPSRDLSRVEERLKEEVRHQLVMLPWYSVFDNLAYRIDGTKVILEGQVQRPSLKPDAEAVVKGIESVETVVNNIEVLPPSPHDDRIRRAAYRAIYRSAALQRYALQAVPPIHIIVKNGHITLEGVVANQGDKDVANIRARGVAGSFSLTNNLAVETN
jgi:hyperosmotically inducible periplasmic protein